MTNHLIHVLLGAALIAAPGFGAAQQSERDRERARERAEAAREREQERREREQERRERDRERAEEQAERRREQERERSSGRYRYDPRDQEARIDTTFAFAADGSVELQLVNGPIVVRTWDRREARVQVTVTRGDLRTSFGPARIDVELHDGHRGGDQRIEVTVPAGTRVRARNFSGDVSVVGSRAAVDARTLSGSVTVSDASDRVVVESVSGEASVSGVTGTARVTTVSGEIDMTGVSGGVEAKSVSGDITMRDVRSKDVRLESVSGGLLYAGTVDRDGRYEFQSHSGDIEIRFPGEPAATFTAETFSGTVESDVPMTVQPANAGATTATNGRRSGSSRRFEFTVGGGGARVTTETFSGTIYIRRAGAAGRD